MGVEFFCDGDGTLFLVSGQLQLPNTYELVAAECCLRSDTIACVLHHAEALCGVMMGFCSIYRRIVVSRTGTMAYVLYVNRITQEN